MVTSLSTEEELVDDLDHIIHNKMKSIGIK